MTTAPWARTLSILLLAAAAACRTAPVFTVPASRFAGADGCFLLQDAATGKLLHVYGERRCRERFPACSTFKLPLAVMAFDAGILQDEHTSFPWDGVERSIASWNQDQTAASWMRNSVVWYSQRITTQLGAARLQSYVDGFHYGNRDLSAGLTSAWLTISKGEQDRGRGSLRISAYEQLEFLGRFWRGDLPVKPDAITRTKQLLYLETSPGGMALHGKTGSGYPEGLQGDFGWFVGHVEGQGREYLVVTTLSRDARAADASYPGLRAKEITKEILGDNGLW